MAAPKRTRVVVLSALSLALGTSGVLVAVGLAGGSEGKTPDLFPALPSDHSNKNSRWIDTFQANGKVLFRFDTVIHNKLGAGALDVFRTGHGADMTQVLWTSGSPGGAVNKGTPLPTASTSGATLVTIPGQKITYSPLAGHHHFHAPLVAKYSLHRMDNTLVADAAKNSAGFCLYDSWGAGGAAHYADGELCRPGEPNYTGGVRMGISPGYGDFYASQLGDQWVDVTAAAPGQYRLRAEVDPARIYNEDPADRGDNVLTTTVTIPGAVVNPPAPVSVAHGASTTFNLTGTVVGAGVKSRLNGSCNTQLEGCMDDAEPGVLKFSLATGPGSAGTATVTEAGRVTFTPASGFAGTATFTVRAKDSRGLGGPPVPVNVTVAGAPQPGVSVTVSPSQASVETGSAAQFSAQIAHGTGPVTWSVNGVAHGNSTVGTISSLGRYTAPAAVPAGGAVTVRATHGSGAAGSATVTVTQAPPDPEVIVALSPGSVTLAPGAAQNFAATVSGTQEALVWTVNGVRGGNVTVGTVTSSGRYTAPATPPQSAVAVRATAPTSESFGESFVTVRVPNPDAVDVRPADATLHTGATIDFDADVRGGTGPVTWSVDGVAGGNASVGTISASGLYTAPADVPAGGTVTVRAAHASGVSGTSTVTVTRAPVDPEVTVTIAPGAATLAPGATQDFIAAVNGTDEPLVWSVDGVDGGNATVGTVTASGRYTAPATPPQRAVAVRATAPTSGAYAEASVTVRVPQRPEPETPVPGPSTPPSTPTVPPPATPPGGSVDVIPPTPRSTKAPVVLRPTFALQSRRGKVYLRARGVASRSQAGRKVAIQRVVNRRLVTISRAKVNERGRFTAMVRVPTRGELSVRAVLGSTRTTRAAKSDVTRLRARWRSASERRDRVVIRPTFMLLARDGGVHLETRGTVDRRLAGRTVAVQRIRGQRIVTIARARVDRRGRYHTSVRVPSAGALDVRATVGATARTTAARSPMVAVRLAGGGA